MKYLYFLFGIMFAWNAFVFALTGYDKYLAKTQRRRIPEKVLLLAGLVFGGAGLWLAMLVFRHKIHKMPFPVTAPLFMLAQSILLLGALGLLRLPFRF